MTPVAKVLLELAEAEMKVDALRSLYRSIKDSTTYAAHPNRYAWLCEIERTAVQFQHTADILRSRLENGSY
jgi:hypothetical protein